jgi:hypothetical protein
MPTESGLKTFMKEALEKFKQTSGQPRHEDL